MKIRRSTQVLILAAFTGIAALGTGCSVVRDQQTVGSYVDDSAITTAVKARLADDPMVSATAISVETLKGTVLLSGFAKSQAEKTRAEELARQGKHVMNVQNNIVVRP